MKRGEVWWVNFDLSVGGEIQKQRPAVIVSNNAANAFLNRIQVVPLSSKTGKVYPSEALVSFNGSESKAIADQIATVSKLRVVSKAGEISPEDLKKIVQAIKIQLAIK